MIGAFGVALWAETLKARRSRMPILTALGFSLAPCVGGLFMLILKDPGRARQWGLIGAKAQLTAGTADWPALWSLLCQATALGGTLLFALVASWVFGREAVEGTAKDLIATAVPRGAIVAAKFMVVDVWCVALACIVWAGGLAAGAIVGLPQWSWPLAAAALGNILITACLTTGVAGGAAFVASAARGYLAPMGFAILMLFLAQVLAVTGWGAWFPWSIPPLYAGLAGEPHLGWLSYAIVAATTAIGMVATFAWWRFADQP